MSIDGNIHLSRGHNTQEATMQTMNQVFTRLIYQEITIHKKQKGTMQTMNQVFIDRKIHLSRVHNTRDTFKNQNKQ